MGVVDRRLLSSPREQRPRSRIPPRLISSDDASVSNPSHPFVSSTSPPRVRSLCTPNQFVTPDRKRLWCDFLAHFKSWKVFISTFASPRTCGIVKAGTRPVLLTFLGARAESHRDRRRGRRTKWKAGVLRRTEIARQRKGRCSTIEIFYEIVELDDVSLLGYTDVAIVRIPDNSSLFSSIRHYMQMRNWFLFTTIYNSTSSNSFIFIRSSKHSIIIKFRFILYVSRQIRLA